MTTTNDIDLGTVVTVPWLTSTGIVTGLRGATVLVSFGPIKNVRVPATDITVWDGQ